MRIVMIFAGVLAVSVAAGSFLYMTQTGPEEISLEVASKPGARADKARVFGGRAKVTSPSPIGDNITGARSHSGAGRAGVTHAKQPEGIGMGTRRAAQSGGTSFNEISAGTGAANYAPGELLVANPPANFENLVVSQGFEVGGMLQLRSLDMKVLRLVTPANVSVTSAVQRLRQQFPGATTDANTLYELSRGGAFPESYARMLIGWPGVPKNCGAGVHLGMIDAGVQPSHPALAGTDIEYRSFLQSGRRPGPANHGTAIAAMMVGKPQPGKGWGGLLPGARLSAANIFQFSTNRKVTASARGLLEAIDWMAEQKVDVVNMSIAGSKNKVVRQVVETARAKGLVLVAAAGNWGTAKRPAYPAAYSDVIAVTAVDADRRIYEFANSGQYIDFSAPGVRVWTAIPGGGQYQSGTSFASPYVSVLTGLVISRGHPRDPDAIRKTLRGKVVDLGDAGRDDTFGWGLVDMQPQCVKVARANVR